MKSIFRHLLLVTVSVLTSFSATVALAGGGNTSGRLADVDTVLCYAPVPAGSPRYFTPSHITLDREVGQSLILDLTIKNDVSAYPFFDNHTQTVRIGARELESTSLVDGIENVVQITFDVPTSSAQLHFVKGPSSGLQMNFACTSSRARKNSWQPVSFAQALQFIL